MFAEIILSQRFPKHLGVFDYAIPTELEKDIALGQLVTIPFRNSSREGVVITLKDKGIVGKKIKPITAIQNTEPMLTTSQLDLAAWMATYYHVSIGTVVKSMLPPIPQRIHVTPEKVVDEESIPPEAEMKKLSDTVCHHTKDSFALLPDTILQTKKFYQAIIKKCSGATMIVVPTIKDIDRVIALVPAQLQSHVVRFHSKLNKNQTYSAWQRVMTDRRAIVVGTKQATFLPLNNLKVIVLDSEASSAHKQSDQNPRYDVRAVVDKLRQLHQCKLISVDSAPTVSLYNNIIDQRTVLLSLAPAQRATITTIDMREERRAQNYGLLSDKLKSDIGTTLNSGKKVFLFINKRGTSSAVMCKDCGQVLSCATCGTTQAYHEKSGLLFCHRCNTQAELPPFCPKCNGANLKMIGSGTQSVEKEIHKLWPKVTVARYDADTDDQPDTKAQIIIGTIKAFTMLPWEDIKLIGIVSADTLLHLPDYRAQERTWQLLHQFTYFSDAPLIIQTHSPNNSAIKYFNKGDAKAFYTAELEDRKILEYPPHGRLIKLFYAHRDKKTMVDKVNKLYTKLSATPLAVSKITPLTPYQHGKWQMYVVIKHTDETPANVISDVLTQLPDGWQIDRDPENLL